MPSKLSDRILSPGTQEKKSSHSVNCAVLLSSIDGSTPRVFKYLISLPANMDFFRWSCGSGSGGFFVSAWAGFATSVFEDMLASALPSGVETLTSGTSGV